MPFGALKLAHAYTGADFGHVEKKLMPFGALKPGISDLRELPHVGSL
jgi:hypothetical protein